MIQYKTTKRLFRNTYQYKIVLVCAGANLFRSGDMESTLESLKKIDLSLPQGSYSRYNTAIKNHDDLDYAFKLQSQLASLSDIDVRVETPWISVYSNNRKDIDLLAKIDADKVKYISIPDTSLSKDTVVMPKTNYDFRITMGKTSQEHSTFVAWAESSGKVKLTNSCKKDLLKNRSWGGTHFYITGEKNLLVAKMHLGGSINKIERIIK